MTSKEGNYKLESTATTKEENKKKFLNTTVTPRKKRKKPFPTPPPFHFHYKRHWQQPKGSLKIHFHSLSLVRRHLIKELSLPSRLFLSPPVLHLNSLGLFYKFLLVNFREKGEHTHKTQKQPIISIDNKGMCVCVRHFLFRARLFFLASLFFFPFHFVFFFS